MGSWRLGSVLIKKRMVKLPRRDGYPEVTLFQSRDPSKEESNNFNVGVVKTSHDA